VAQIADKKQNQAVDTFGPAKGSFEMQGKPLPSLDKQQRIRAYLERLSKNVPKVLLLEGGELNEREELALYWACCLHCPASAAPCLECSVCRQILEGVHRDFYFLDGRQGTIKIDAVRSLRSLMAQRPESGGKRLFIFNQAQEMTPNAVNALLKSLEEPLPDNIFILLAPQREWLLPTLISRSWVLTLSCKQEKSAPLEELQKWQACLVDFWQSGKGLFEYTAKKSEIDQELVRTILVFCQQELTKSAYGGRDSELSKLWSQRFTAQMLSQVSHLFLKAQEALNYQVNPALVLDWTALQVWKWLQD
jgi:DNA polymerase-3 subunit delta'